MSAAAAAAADIHFFILMFLSVRRCRARIALSLLT